MKVSDKIEKIGSSFTVYLYDNGYMIEASGRDEENDYKDAKIIVSSEEELLKIIQDIVAMPRDQ